MSVAEGLEYASERPRRPSEQRTEFRRQAGDRTRLRVSKRVFDILLGIALLPVLVPAIALLWALTRLDGGPGFFGHTRVGLNGKSFKCWKIRSMVVDAEERLQAHLAAHPEAAEEWARDHKLTDDPRITPLGRFLRVHHLEKHFIGCEHEKKTCRCGKIVLNLILGLLTFHQSVERSKCLLR